MSQRSFAALALGGGSGIVDASPGRAMTVLDVAMDDSAKSKLLLVDDEVRFAERVARALERPGLEVRVCNDGASGLEVALRWPADLVLLDARMPGMDGWEVCRRLRAAGYSAPILLYSAYDTEEDTVAALGAGADDHVSKQASMAVLWAKIQRWLERRLSDERRGRVEASPGGALGGSGSAPPQVSAMTPNDAVRIFIAMDDVSVDWQRVGAPADDTARAAAIADRAEQAAGVTSPIAKRLAALKGSSILQFWLVPAIEVTVRAADVPRIAAWPEVREISDAHQETVRNQQWSVGYSGVEGRAGMRTDTFISHGITGLEGAHVGGAVRVGAIHSVWDSQQGIYDYLAWPHPSFQYCDPIYGCWYTTYIFECNAGSCSYSSPAISRTQLNGCGGAALRLARSLSTTPQMNGARVRWPPCSTRFPAVSMCWISRLISGRAGAVVPAIPPASTPS